MGNINIFFTSKHVKISLNKNEILIPHSSKSLNISKSFEKDKIRKNMLN